MNTHMYNSRLIYTIIILAIGYTMSYYTKYHLYGMYNLEMYMLPQ